MTKRKTPHEVGAERSLETRGAIDVSGAAVCTNRKRDVPDASLARRIIGPSGRDDVFVKMFLQPDMHCPYQDKRALELILRVMEGIKPEVAIVLGDHWDFFAVSDHRKELSRKLDLEWEITEGDRVLKMYEQLGVFKRKIFCEGNHEWRLTRYVADRATEVYRTLAPAGLLSTKTLPDALNFKARGWEWIPYKDYGRVGRFHFTHDVERAGKTAHEHAQGDFETSSAIGHTHRMSMMVRGNFQGQWSTGAMFGWLGDWKQVDYRHRMKIRREWPLGFGIVYVEKATDIAHVVPVLIHSERRRYRCLVEGKLYTA